VTNPAPSFTAKDQKRFVLDDVQAEFPAFRAIVGELLAMDNVQATRNEEEVAVIIHSAEFDHHALLDGLDEFLFVGGGKISLLKPVREGEKQPPGFRNFTADTKNFRGL